MPTILFDVVVGDGSTLLFYLMIDLFIVVMLSLKA